MSWDLSVELNVWYQGTKLLYKYTLYIVLENRGFGSVVKHCRSRDCEFDPPSHQLKILKGDKYWFPPRKDFSVYQCYTLLEKRVILHPLPHCVPRSALFYVPVQCTALFWPCVLFNNKTTCFGIDIYIKKKQHYNLWHAQSLLFFQTFVLLCLLDINQFSTSQIHVKCYKSGNEENHREPSEHANVLELLTFKVTFVVFLDDKCTFLSKCWHGCWK